MTYDTTSTPLRLLAVWGVIVLVTRCATVYEGKYAWSEGWRAAEAVEVTAASEIERPRFYDCVRTAAPEQLANSKFAVVKYREMSRTNRRAILVQPDQSFARGDLVCVKADDCLTPLVVR